jgi:hypothetical protein
VPRLRRQDSSSRRCHEGRSRSHRCHEANRADDEPTDCGPRCVSAGFNKRALSSDSARTLDNRGLFKIDHTPEGSEYLFWVEGFLHGLRHSYCKARRVIAKRLRRLSWANQLNLHFRGLPVRLPDELYLGLKKCHEHWDFLIRVITGSLRTNDLASL